MGESTMAMLRGFDEPCILTYAARFVSKKMRRHLYDLKISLFFPGGALCVRNGGTDDCECC